MRSAVIAKAAVLQEKSSRDLTLVGYALSGSDKLNFKLSYDFDTLDIEGFLKDLREAVAAGLDVAASQVDLQEGRLLKLMKRQQEYFRSVN